MWKVLKRGCGFVRSKINLNTNIAIYKILIRIIFKFIRIDIFYYFLSHYDHGWFDDAHIFTPFKNKQILALIRIIRINSMLNTHCTYLRCYTRYLFITLRIYTSDIWRQPSRWMTYLHQCRSVAAKFHILLYNSIWKMLLENRCEIPTSAHRIYHVQSNRYWQCEQRQHMIYVKILIRKTGFRTIHFIRFRVHCIK